MAFSYDQLPYNSKPHQQSQPEHLAATGRVCGLPTPAIESGRVLELGCASGGNLLPLAVRYPQAQFVGVDGSKLQIRDGQRRQGQLSALGAATPNLQLLHRDILQVNIGLGRFDYIICHGVFSWVPFEVQERILSTCREFLSPNGVAYISYNVQPGWKLRGIVRDLVRLYDNPSATPEERFKLALTRMTALAGMTPEKNNPYGILLKRELESAIKSEASYFLHEYLEEHNQPFYFSDFVERAARHHLAYLADAEDFPLSPSEFGDQARNVLQALAKDRIALEQHLDILRLRTFRRTLLRRVEDLPTATSATSRLNALYVASPVRPEKPVEDIHLQEEVTFKGRRAATCVNDPIVKAAFLHLGSIWPKPVLFSELLALAQSRAHQAPADGSQRAREAERLATALLRSFAASQVELTTGPPRFAGSPGARPRVWALARLQARTVASVTNMRHGEVALTDDQRWVLGLVDGTRDRPQLVQEMMNMAAKGRLTVQSKGQTVTDPAIVQTVLDDELGGLLQFFALAALLEQ